MADLKPERRISPLPPVKKRLSIIYKYDYHT